MISRNLRHLRVFLAVADSGWVTAAAAQCHVSQPAVTQAVNKLEDTAGGSLFQRTRSGFYLTPRGTILAKRVTRVFEILDPSLRAISPRLLVTATSAQLRALIAVQEHENESLAARHLGLAQPTVHRAIAQIEKEAGRPLFDRTSFGLTPTRACRALARAALLAVGELDQAEAEIAELDGGEAGRIVIGALPLSRSVVLPQALVRFRQRRPTLPISVIDGFYDELLTGLRRGEIDVIMGALRHPVPIADVVQERLFDDRLTILCRNNHPLAARNNLSVEDLRDLAWVVPRHGAPTRQQFDACFIGSNQPGQVIEAGSILLMREILCESDHLGCISKAQADAEIAKGLLTRVDFRHDWPARPIGLTYRDSWVPTRAQAEMLDCIRNAVPGGDAIA